MEPRGPRQRHNKSDADPDLHLLEAADGVQLEAQDAVDAAVDPLDRRSLVVALFPSVTVSLPRGRDVNIRRSFLMGMRTILPDSVCAPGQSWRSLHSKPWAAAVSPKLPPGSLRVDASGGTVAASVSEVR